MLSTDYSKPEDTNPKEFTTSILYPSLAKMTKSSKRNDIKFEEVHNHAKTKL